jgi:hypothetical protein
MTPKSITALEELGRVRLSRSFFMRDFLYSEISNFYGIPNIPENPDLAVEVGKRLCEELLEQLNATFGRIAIRSAYCSPENGGAKVCRGSAGIVPVRTLKRFARRRADRRCASCR